MQEHGDGYGKPPEDVDGRLAQQASPELARMGIDPAMLGLAPAQPAPPPAVTRAFGVASVAWPSHQPPPAGNTAPYPEAPPPPPPAAFGHPPVAPPTAPSTTYRSAPVGPPAVVVPPVPQPRVRPVPPHGPPGTATMAAQPVLTGPATALARPLGPGPGQPPAAPGYRPGAGGAAGEVPERRGIVTPGGWRRGVRMVTLGLVQPGAAAAVAHEHQLVARVRVRQGRPRTIAFLAGKGGVGTTTTAAGVALTLATLRHDTTALLDARRGAASIGRRMAGHAAPTVRQLAGQQHLVEPLRLFGRLGVVDGLPWHEFPVAAEFDQVLERLTERFAFTVVDVGDDLDEVSASALRRADQVVVVTTPTYDAVEAAGTVLGRVYDVDPHRLASAVIAVVCVGARPYRRAVRRLRIDLGLEPARIVPVPFDPALAAGHRMDPAAVRPLTREAYLRLGGLIAERGVTGVGGSSGGDPASGQWSAHPPVPVAGRR